MKAPELKIRPVHHRLHENTALAPQRLLGRVMSQGWHPFHRTAALVLGGLEMACWDVAGKYLGQPVSMFFGGALRAGPAYFSWPRPPSFACQVCVRTRQAVRATTPR